MGFAPWRFHPAREQLLAEAHARPSTPLATPMLATRIATLSGEGGAESDRLHMAALCRRVSAAEPGPTARWCVLEAGPWRLRWERHTEVSTWTFFAAPSLPEVWRFSETALDLVPRDWLAALPGEVMAAAHVVIVPRGSVPRESGADMPLLPYLRGEDLVAARVVEGLADVLTDFRAGPDGFTRFLIETIEDDPVVLGRIVQQLFEIETYRLLAMMAFPLAGETARSLTRMELESEQASAAVAMESGLAADRVLINTLARMAGEAQALSARTRFRFAAARAYAGLVHERLQQLRETRLFSRPTLSDFMDRRLAPAMRTCEAVEQRQQGVIEHISRTSQMLSTRVEVAAEVTNANLLTAMNERSDLQLRLQETVEGLSVAAISYYAVGLLGYGFKALGGAVAGFDATLATGLSVPVVIAGVWFVLRRVRRKLQRRRGPAADAPGQTSSNR